MDVKQRNSNIELLRIFSMLAIVFHHFSIHGNFYFSSPSVNSLYLMFIQMGGKISVVCFTLISGYFLVNSSGFRLTRLIKLWLQLLTWSLGLYFVSVIAGAATFNIKELIQTLTPVSSEQWWYASAYFVMFLLSPFLNKGLRALSQKQYINLLIVETLMWSVLGIITFRGFQSNYLVSLIYYYTIGGYFKLYKDDLSIKKGHNIAAIAGLGALTYALRVVLDLLGDKVSLIGLYAPYVYELGSPFGMLIAIFTFLLFKNFKVKNSRVINTIAAASFGVYLIHDNEYIRPVLWDRLVNASKLQDSPYLILYSVAVCVGIYAVCTILELARIYLLEKNYMKLVYRVEPQINRVIGKILSPIYKIMK